MVYAARIEHRLTNSACGSVVYVCALWVLFFLLTLYVALASDRDPCMRLCRVRMRMGLVELMSLVCASWND